MFDSVSEAAGVYDIGSTLVIFEYGCWVFFGKS